VNKLEKYEITNLEDRLKMLEEINEGAKNSVRNTYISLGFSALVIFFVSIVAINEFLSNSILSGFFYLSLAITNIYFANRVYLKFKYIKSNIKPREEEIEKVKAMIREKENI